MGHALGLQHSDKPGAVMYPYYRRFDHLQTEDVTAIRKLYPAPVTETAVVTPQIVTSTESEGTPTTVPPPAVPSLPTPPPHVPVVTPAPALSLKIAAVAPVRTATADASGTVSGGVGSVQITWSSATAAGRADGSSSWRATGIPLVVGSNLITFTAEDREGNRITQSITVERLSGPPPEKSTDTAAPSITIVSPAATSSATTSASVRISGTARDNVGVRQVTWQTATASGTASGTTSWTFELPLHVGDNSVVVRATDDAGNTGWRSLMITRR